MRAASGIERVTVEGRELKLTSLDRPVYPSGGGADGRAPFTKRDVLAYYAAIAPAILPHLRDRAVEARIFPDGVEAGGFWQRDLPVKDQRPEWLEAARVHADTRGGDIEYPHLVDLPSLLWAANRNMLELHLFLARYQSPRTPTTLVFDLDPGAGRDVVDCADIALVIRDVLEGEGLRAFPKASGGKGLQLYVPLNGARGQEDITFAETKRFARQLAEGFEHLQPRRITAKVAKSERKGKVLIDWGQNERNHLMVAPYSLRARPERQEPTVSAPLAWREVERIADEADPTLARVTPDAATRRVEKEGDLFAPVLAVRQALPDV